MYTNDVLHKLLGTVQTETCKIAVREMKLPITAQQFNHEFNTLTHKYLPNVPKLPGS